MWKVTWWKNTSVFEQFGRSKNVSRSSCTWKYISESAIWKKKKMSENLAVLGNSPPLADQVSHWPCRLSPGRGITIRLDISAITIYDDKTTKKMTAAMTADCQKTWSADWHCQLESFYASRKSLRVTIILVL